MMKPLVIDSPTDRDILFGRDAESWNHEGNRSFRLLVARFQDDYHSSESRVKKVAIVAKIVKELEHIDARFLRRDKSLKSWCEVDRKAAIEKVGHAIRDKQIIAQRTIQKKQSVAGKGGSNGTRGDYVNYNDVSDNTFRNDERMEAKIKNGEHSQSPPPPRFSLSAHEKQQLLEEQHAGAMPSAIRDEILLRHHMMGGATLGTNLVHHTTLTALRRAQVEYDALRKMAAAEEYLASLQKRQALEDEIAFLRQRSMIFNSLHTVPSGIDAAAISAAGARRRSASTLLDLHASLAAAAAGSPASALAAAAQTAPSYAPSSGAMSSSATQRSHYEEAALRSLGFDPRCSFSSS